MSAEIGMTNTAVRTTLAEHAETVRGEARYFLVVPTAVGVLEATITRSDNDRRNGERDARADASLFMPGSARNSWVFVASLGYHEMTSRDMPMHGDLAPWLDRLRFDAGIVLDRAEAILRAHREAES